MADGSEPHVDFRRDIRPILSDKCFHCHGPNDADRQGGFRFDQQEGAFGQADSGYRPIVPGSLEESAIVRRITSDDENERMPPPDARKSLGDEEIQLIKRWIEQGAKWDEHWSFVSAQRPEIPAAAGDAWAANEIDHFIVRRLETEQLAPSAEAAKGTLLRRLALDLTGLPPTDQQLQTFLADGSSGAYEKQVDTLLASPHFGEHQARFWLDAVRYADTHGLHLDNYREMWPYRDWVVTALNENMPFDEFATQQLAGHLLDDPTTDQLIASGYNRCHVTTNEGGSIAEEVHIRNVIDRVVTTATVFLGLTFDCTRCHDHKYDPLTPYWTGRQDAQALFSRLWGAGFLPSEYQGVALRSAGDPVLFLSDPPGIDRSARRRMLDALAKVNEETAKQYGDPETVARIAQYEMAHRLQASVPKLVDTADESEHVLEMYGDEVKKPGSFAASCLLARRMAERGVRFVQIFHRGWDQHANIANDLPKQCADIDQPAHALIQDLKQRDMLDDTLVVWGGEFGRTVYCQGELTKENYGRDHHPRCFTMWMAGGGVKPGIEYGATDDFCYNVTENPVHIHDLNATILHLLGIDHTRLSYRVQGLDMRLTGVEAGPAPVRDILL